MPPAGLHSRHFLTAGTRGRMSWFDFDWVDAFSDTAFGGNGCAVVHGGAHLPETVCTAFVRETSLVECTFTGPSDVADFRVRYFLASRSAYSAREKGRSTSGMASNSIGVMKIISMPGSGGDQRLVGAIQH